MQPSLESPVSKEAGASSPTHERIAKTAHRLFLSEGYSKITTDRLCREAAVSKSSLYKYFGDMAGVLAAVVRLQGDSITEGVMPEPLNAEQFWASVVAYGCNLLTLLSQRSTINLDRRMHEQSSQMPEATRLFYDSSYGRSHVELTAMLRFGQQRGFLTKPQPAADLADYIFCAWCGLPYAQARLGLTDQPFADPATRAIDCTRSLFESDFRL